MPSAASAVTGRVTGRPRTSARSWHQYGSGGATGQHEGAVERGAEQVEMVEAEPLDERDALQHAGEPVALVGRAAQPETLRLRRDEREALARRHQRVGQHTRRLVRGGTPVEVVEVGAGEVAGDRPGAGAGRAAGQPVAVGRLVRVHDAGRVADQIARHPLEHQRRAEHGVPAARAQYSRAELRGAPVGGSGDDRGPRGRPVSSAAAAHTVPSGVPGRTSGGSTCAGTPSASNTAVGHVSSTRSAPVFSALLRSVATGPPTAGPSPSRSGGPAGRAARIGVLAEQPQQFRQRPRRLHPLVAELLPNRRADLVDPVDLGGRAGVVVHEARGQRVALAVDEQDGPRGGVDGHPAHRAGVDVASASRLAAATARHQSSGSCSSAARPVAPPVAGSHCRRPCRRR